MTESAAPHSSGSQADSRSADVLHEIALASWKQVRDAFEALPHTERLGLADLFRALAAQPERVQAIQQRYYDAHRALWEDVVSGRTADASTAALTDVRFQAEAWTSQPFFRLLKQVYLLNCAWLTELVEAAALPAAQARRMRFVLRQALDALAPTNFPASNPEVIELAARTSGASLVEGWRHLQSDTARGRVAMTDEAAFRVGGNLAITPGEVLFENPIVQLIRYTPLTEQVYARPLLIVPPFINKYYILDLRPENSFVRYAVEQGFQVFIISWRNAGQELARATWDDYAQRGVLDALDAVLQISGAHSANVLGFCVGGTLLATVLASMPRPQRVASVTLLATMLDFTDVGEIGAYVDEAFVGQCEANFRAGGLMPGRRLAEAFASLRANELVWHFVIENYLKGRAPPAFDLLYWNGDSANLPGPLFTWYLRNMYLENNLRVPGKLRVLGQPVDLGRIVAPTYVLATREDHIVPWHAAFVSAQLLGGKIQFVLGASGHIAGVINPAAAAKRSYWVGATGPADADAWLQGATRQAGSWWPHWCRWLKQRAGRRVSAQGVTSSASYPRIEPAPGRYVLERAQ